MTFLWQEISKAMDNFIYINLLSNKLINPSFHLQCLGQQKALDLQNKISTFKLRIVILGKLVGGSNFLPQMPATSTPYDGQLYFRLTRQLNLAPNFHSNQRRTREACYRFNHRNVLTTFDFFWDISLTCDLDFNITKRQSAGERHINFLVRWTRATTVACGAILQITECGRNLRLLPLIWIMKNNHCYETFHDQEQITDAKCTVISVGPWYFVRKNAARLRSLL